MMASARPPMKPAHSADAAATCSGSITASSSADEVKSTTESFGLFRNPPRAMRTEITRYLREREADADWFDGTVLVARKAVKRLYALNHIKPDQRAQRILFDQDPPAGSRLHALRVLSKAEGAGQSMASSLNIAAFNLGNALGAWLGGAVITHGPGLGALPWAAAVLTVGGLAAAWVSVRLDQRTVAVVAPTAAAACA